MHVKVSFVSTGVMLNDMERAMRLERVDHVRALPSPPGYGYAGSSYCCGAGDRRVVVQSYLEGEQGVRGTKSIVA